MTVKRAITLIDFLIEFEEKMQKIMVDPAHPWNYSFDCVKDLANTLAKSHEDNIRILNIIKKELVPNCKHPKKMRDKSPDGKWYCLNCNSDI